MERKETIKPDANSKPIGLTISDLAGLIVGYSLAALLVRSFRAEFEPLGLGKLVAVLVSFVWLGLAMSGPIVLLLGNLNSEPSDSSSTSRYSWMEMAWIGIGGYFVALTLFVVPARNHEPPWSMIIFGQAMAFVSLLMWILTHPKQKSKNKLSSQRWTTSTAKVLMLSWPLAWAALILVFL